MGKQRIAILGGGMAALTCAFEITNAVGWQDAYDITVYQLGWRLGGKGASGRNVAHHDRIEEHGLHILLGFYENAFRVLKQAYGELGRPAGTPLATWQDAFKPHNYVVLMEATGAEWKPWAMNFPPNCDEPGTGGVLPTPWAMIQMMLGWLKQLFVDSPRLPDEHEDLDAARAKAASRDHSGVLHELYELHEWLHARDQEINDIDWKRDFVTVDLGVAAIKGMIEDGVILPPYDYFKLDTLDFRAWLSKYGAHDVSVNSAYISGMYDLGFSLPGQVGAGTALNGILRMCWTYKGAVMWKMQAGMGDTIFGPLYLVLKNRGVKFEFFSRVDNLGLSADSTRVDTIAIGRQMRVKNGEYNPLVTVKNTDGDLECWPSEPQYDQLERGAELKASGENLEDWWTAWPDAEQRVLRYGDDFDTVVLGCSLGVFPYIAKELIAKSPPLAEMVQTVGTTQTQAAQLWQSCDLAGLGWTLPSPVLDGYAEPMDTWADMSHLLVRENWGDAVKNLAYLCSPLPDDGPLPPRTDHGYAQRQDARVKANAIEWLTNSAKGLWPRWDWSLLVGSNAVGPARFDSQYWLATLNPSDRYVLALPNSVFKRLPADGAGFQNLVMAGDYLKTGMNVGCVEAATMGGMHASRAICGRPEVIVGDDASSFSEETFTGEAPAYITRGGDLVMSPPLELTSATMYSFLLPANGDALTSMIDSQLNAVTAPSGIYYKPLMPMVAIVAANIAKSYSTTPPDSQKGWMGERDFSVWVPVVKYHGGKPGKIGWYLPYVFVDNVAAMVTGREVFGFFKQTAALGMPSTPDAAGTFTIDALAIPKFSSSSQAETIRLMTMQSTTGSSGRGSKWTGVREAVTDIWGAVRKAAFGGPSLRLAWDVIENMTEDLITGDVPMVFLKQFRAAGDASRACYQAVIEAPSHLQRWYGGGFTNPHDITITPADSHPIVQECGLAGSQLRAELGFWTQMDFVMQPGIVVAERR